MQKNFHSHKLSDQGYRKLIKVAYAFEKALENLLKEVPEGRERRKMISKLEEACFWAKRGVAVDESNHAKDNVAPTIEEVTEPIAKPILKLRK